MDARLKRIWESLDSETQRAFGSFDDFCSYWMFEKGEREYEESGL